MNRDAESPIERLRHAEADAKARQDAAMGEAEVELAEAMEWAEEKIEAANERAEVKLEEANERAELKLEEAYERADEKLAYIDGRSRPDPAPKVEAPPEPIPTKKGGSRGLLILAAILLLALLAALGAVLITQ